MKRYGYLFEKVTALENLFWAAQKAFRRKKRSRSAAAFYFDLEKNLLDLESELRTECYMPLPYRTFHVWEPKKRLICAADFRDRVVHHAICNVLEPMLDRTFIFDTYACRKGRGTHAAIQRAQAFSRRFPWVLKCDIRNYFASVDHAVLKGLLKSKIKDVKLLRLLDVIIDQPVPESPPGKGLPIGNLTSQLFANSYLSELDHRVKEGMSIQGYLRYMDDFLLFAAGKAVLKNGFKELAAFVRDRLKLEIKREAVMLRPVSEGIIFLGFSVFPKTIRLSHKTRSRFQKKIKTREKVFRAGRIDEDYFVNSINSMVAHIGQANTHAFRKTVFS